MSYVVTIKKIIDKDQFVALIENDSSFKKGNFGEGYSIFHWSDGESYADFIFSNNQIQVTTPSDNALEKMNQIAAELGAIVEGEEDAPIVKTEIKRGVFSNRDTWVGWPVLVIILSILLIWKW